MSNANTAACPARWTYLVGFISAARFCWPVAAACALAACLGF